MEERIAALEAELAALHTVMRALLSEKPRPDIHRSLPGIQQDTNRRINDGKLLIDSRQYNDGVQALMRSVRVR
jgi:hypothetical protein